MDKNLIDFLKNQKLLAIATIDHENKPWIANVYYSVDGDLNLFFVSPQDTNHSKHIQNNSRVAFTISWYNKDNLSDRKAVQGRGVCRLLENPKEIVRFLTNHYKYFPSWKDEITYENMLQKIIESRPYIIKPTYMKFWNDELFGEEGTREFNFGGRDE